MAGFFSGKIAAGWCCGSTITVGNKPFSVTADTAPVTMLLTAPRLVSVGTIGLT